MVVVIEVSASDNRYVLGYPETGFKDCAHGSEREPIVEAKDRVRSIRA